MSKGAVITPAFCEALGLSNSLYTLSKNLVNQPHPVLLEPMFHIHVEELPETIYLERQYLFDNQLSIKPSYGLGEKVLLWLRRVYRRRNDDPNEPENSVMLASDLFLMNDPKEFLRFRLFLRSKRIVDTQARHFLAKNAEKFGELAESRKGLRRICECLGNIAEWPDPENGFRKNHDDQATLEGLAKNYSEALVAVRQASELPMVLLEFQPEVRLNVFRLMCFAEDKNDGAQSLMVFLRDLASASGVDKLVRAASQINSGADLSKTLDQMRSFLGLPVDLKARLEAAGDGVPKD